MESSLRSYKHIANHVPHRCETTLNNRNIHVRLKGSTPLSNVGSYNPSPPLGARCPSQHTSGQGVALIPNCHILVRLHCSTILLVLGHALTILFLRTYTRTSQWITHHGIALVRTRLTSEFLQNPKPMSSQKVT